MTGRHYEIWRDVYWFTDGAEDGGEVAVCGTCVPRHSFFPSRADVPEWPCPDSVHHDEATECPTWGPVPAGDTVSYECRCQQPEGTACPQCGDTDTWFDRSVCPEPCGAMHTRCTGCGAVTGHPCPFDEHQLGHSTEETPMPHTCHHPGCTDPGSGHHTLARGVPQCAAFGCDGAARETAGLCPDDTPGCLYYGGCTRTTGAPVTWWHARHLARVRGAWKGVDDDG